MTKKAKWLTSLTFATTVVAAPAIAFGVKSSEANNVQVVSQVNADNLYKATTSSSAAPAGARGTIGTESLVFVYNRAKQKFEDARQVVEHSTDIDAIQKAVLDMEEQMTLLEKYNVIIKERNAIANPLDPNSLAQVNEAVRAIRMALDEIKYEELDAKATLPMWTPAKEEAGIGSLSIEGIIRKMVSNMEAPFIDYHELFKHEYLLPRFQQIVENYNRAVRFANDTKPLVTQKAKDTSNIIIISFSTLAAALLGTIAFLTIRKMKARI